MSTLKILIIEEEADIRSDICQTLHDFTVYLPFLKETFDFKLIEAATREEVTKSIDSEDYDIALMADNFSKIHGIEVIEYIRKKKKPCIVILMISYVSSEFVTRTIRSGAYDFLLKPFTAQELKTAIQSACKELCFQRINKNRSTKQEECHFTFLPVLLHELKSPLNVVEGYLHMMQEKQFGDYIGDYSFIINRSLERIKGMYSLITDMLDLTQLESGIRSRKIEEIDLVETMQTVEDNIHPMITEKNIHISIDAEPESIMYQADRQEIEIIINNLLSNAIKYNKKNGDIRCILREQEKEIELSVSDTGIGIAQEDLSKLFQPFVRIKNEKTKAITGSGLGLSITKKIVEEMYHGRISVTSVSDEGSTFTIKLPK